MDVGLDKARLMQYAALGMKLLGEPAKMRVAVIAGILGVAVAAVYLPLSGEIDQARSNLAAQRNRLACIKDVESLRKDAAMYRSRIAQGSDTNEWVQYLLAGSRQADVHLRDMESKEPQKVGPYKAVSLSVELEGNYQQLKSFVEWLEQSDRLLRVESVRFEKQPHALLMKVQVLGLVQKTS